MNEALTVLVWVLCILAILVLIVFLGAIIFFSISFHRFYKEEKAKIQNQEWDKGLVPISRRRV